MMFRSFARSNSSIWYARGFNRVDPESCFATKLAIVSSSSGLSLDPSFAFSWVLVSSFALRFSL